METLVVIKGYCIGIGEICPKFGYQRTRAHRCTVCGFQAFLR